MSVKNEKNFKVRCNVCPRRCVFNDEGEIGWCGTRQRQGNLIIGRTYGLTTGTGMDPVEKKPLYHFYPGTYTYSIGNLGCNLACQHCQNWSISQDRNRNLNMLHSLPPEKAIAEAKRNKVNSISLTYNEPLIAIEYLKDIATIAHNEGIKIIAVTNGYVTEETARELVPYVDAANIDIKGFTKEFYQKICKGNLDPVLRTAEIFVKENVWVELTTLLIPGLNDSLKEIRNLVQWIIENLHSSIPLHLSKFFPNHLMHDRPPTPDETVKKLRKYALELGLNYCYTGNLYHPEGANTYCHQCGVILIQRQGYNTKITENLVPNPAKCLECGTKIPIVI